MFMCATPTSKLTCYYNKVFKMYKEHYFRLFTNHLIVDHLLTVCLVPSVVYIWQIGGFLIFLETSYFHKFIHSKLLHLQYYKM